MSTTIKPGQTWADKNGNRLRVDLVRPAHVEYTWVGGIMHILTIAEFLDAFELVEDATAPLDPTTARKAVVDALATVLPSATVDYELLNAATDAVVATLNIRAGGAR
ncbi:hypothetical protein ACFS27_03230 [Promicromonospora vindobonensis]|uniref:Uncharacterized protein n=1 Tax=Promicromonospora vindobonensis TaxID=195748 RepID=A0ABW5VLH1_9MICO